MNLRVGLALGRVSNLPTVWSNLTAGMVLAGGLPPLWVVGSALLGGSLLYVGGMFLNDAFDAPTDARERPERPIPSGQVERRTVYAYGGGMLLSSLLIFGFLSALRGTSGTATIVAAVTTAALVVVYNAWHKENPVAPLVMGGCRAGLYAIGASLVGGSGFGLGWTPVLGLGYVAGITWVARSEAKPSLTARWPLALLFAPLLACLPQLAQGWAPRLVAAAMLVWLLHAQSLIGRGGPRNIQRGVAHLIAGISLLDALLVAPHHVGAMIAALAAFLLTLASQRRVAGT